MTVTDKKAKKDKQADKKKRHDGRVLTGPAKYAGLIYRVVPPAFVFGLGYIVALQNMMYSETEKKMSIWARFIFFIVAQGVSTDLFATLLLQVGRFLNGEHEFATCGPSQGELAAHDSTIPWPKVELLSTELRAFVSKKGQPFSLNHVTGRRRCKDAMMRIGMNLGTLVTLWCVCRWMDKRTTESLGLTFDAPFFGEMFVGLCVGVTIVGCMFLGELWAGWVQFLQFFEVFDPSENFFLCIFWDVVFHINVALNEELPVRGWMLYNLAEACVAHFGIGPIKAVLAAMLMESVFFVVMHLPSPGGTRPQSMLNIFVGGMAGGLNVLFTRGRLGFALGWHFGWNISMGNVFGRSTSGIPISATFISVAPHPEKKHLHGGVFGPEGGVLAPAAYSLGILLLALVYGLPDEAAGQRLARSFAS